MSDDIHQQISGLTNTIANGTDAAVTSGPSAPVPAPIGPVSTERVAPAWHTILLVVVIVGFSFASAGSQHKIPARHGRAILYGMTAFWEWLMVGYIAWGIRKRTKLSALIGGRWKSVEDALLDGALGVGFWFVALIVLGLLGYAMGMAHGNVVAEAKQKLDFLVPHGALELTLFLALSATAGFCEEVIFRGYFQRQFSAVTNSVVAGVILQGIVFGAGHAYEGGKRMLLIAVYGIMFGILTAARNSLRPGMLAHFIHDASAGIAMQKLLR